MAKIKPLKALRFTNKAGDISDNVCPPYDIINEEERLALIRRSPYNHVQLELPVGEDKYAQAGALLQEWISSGILQRDEEEGVFVYRESFFVKDKAYVFTGLICLTKLYEFSERVVLPHEETLSKAKTDRFNLMSATNCNFSSVYSLYLDEDNKISPILSKGTQSSPLYSFTDEEEVTHTLWKITDEQMISGLQAAFSDKQLFIADGHHRYETALNYKKHLESTGSLEGTTGDYLMMTLVDMDDKGLVIFPTHRLITGLSVDKEELLKKIEPDFYITEHKDITEVEETLGQYTHRHAFAMYDGGEGFTLLVAKEHVDEITYKDRSEAYARLDVTTLHTLILEKALGIDKENMAKQTNLRYTRSAQEAIDKVKSGECVLSFIINPTKIHEIKNVAQAGDKMPQKSTYFYPKLKSGLIINKLD